MVGLMILSSICKPIYGQLDSTTAAMKFDLGITRDQNINLWPLFRISHETDKNNLQVLFPIYGRQSNLADNSVKSHLLPAYWNYKDSSLSDKRILSLYYPSVLRIKNDKERDIKSVAFLQLAPKIQMLEFAKSKDGLFVENNLLFFLWSKNDVENQTSHLICFPAYWSFSKPDRKFSTFLPLYSYGSYNNRQNNYLAITPLYWHFNNGVSKTNFFLPVYYSKRDSIQNKKILFPLAWKFENEKYKSFTFLPLYSKGASQVNENKYLMAGTLYWQFSSEIAKNRLLFPIYFDRKRYQYNDTSVIKTVFPLYWSYSDDSHKNKLFLPFVCSLKNENFKSLTILPIYSGGHSSDFQKKYLMLGSIYWKFENEESTKKAILPIYWCNKKYYENDTSVFRTIFPVYWSNKNNYSNNKIFFPLVWSFKNDYYKSFTLIPFYSKGYSLNDDSQYQMFSMIYWQFSSENSKFQTLLPIYWNKQKFNDSDTSNFKTIFPLYWSYQNNEKNIRVFAPLAWSENNSNYKSFTLLPLYSGGHSINHEYKHRMVASVYWQFDNPKKSSKMLLPVYWYNKNYYEKDTSVFRTIFPIYWANKNNTKQNAIAFPVIWKFKNENYKSFTLAPLYSKGQSEIDNSGHQMLGMVYWQFSSENSKFQTLLPIYWNKKKFYEHDTSDFKTIFPLYWSYHDNKKNIRAFAPLAWSENNPYYKSFTLLPLYSGGHSPHFQYKHLMLAAVYWQFDSPKKSNKVLFPVYWCNKNYSKQDTTVFKTLFPIYWANKNNDIDNKIVFPFSYSLKNDDYKSYTFFPFYSKGVSAHNGTDYKMLSMVYWKFETHNKTLKTLFPVYWSYKKYGWKDTTTFRSLFPIYWASKNNSKNHKIIFPISWSLKNDHFQSYTLFPLYSKGHSIENDNKYLMVSMVYWKFESENHKTNILFPFYWSQKQFYDGDTLSSKTIFPFYWEKKNWSGSHKVVFPIAWNFKNKYYESFTLFPLYSKGHSTDGSKAHRMYSMLYWQFDSQDSKFKTIIPIYFSKKKFTESDTSSFKVLFPVYLANKDKNTDNKIVFPLSWSLKNENYKSYTFFPLFSKGYSSEKDRKHLMFSPLYWQFETKNRSSKTFIPLLNFTKKYVENDTIETNTILPIYWANKSNSVDNKVVFPLVWSMKNEKSKSFTFLPLYSKGSNNNNQKYMAITPLFWKFDNKEESRSTLIPFYSKYKNTNGDEKSNVLLFVMRHNQTGDRSSTQILWPICESARDSGYKYFRFAPVVWYKKTQDSKFFSVQPFYYTSENKEAESHHVFWQLYATKNQFGYKNSKSILWKLFYKDNYDNKDYETRFLYLAYANVKKEGKIEKSFFPICYKSSDDKGNKSFAAFFYFYNKFQRRIGESNDYYKEEKIFWFIRLRSNYKALKKQGKIDKRIYFG
jgi:hypothetical protein